MGLLTPTVAVFVYAAFSTANTIFLPRAAKAACSAVIRELWRGSSMRRTSFSSQPSCFASLTLLIFASRIARYNAAFAEMEKSPDLPSELGLDRDIVRGKGPGPL